MFFLLLVILVVTVLCQSVDQLHKDLIINEAALCETQNTTCWCCHQAYAPRGGTSDRSLQLTQYRVTAHRSTTAGWWPLTSVSVDLAVVVLNEFFNESTILVQDLISHVGDVMEHRLILHLMQRKQPWLRRTPSTSRHVRFNKVHSVHTEYVTYHEVLLQWRPRVHDRDRSHGVQSLQGNDLAREFWEATVHRTLRTYKTGRTVRTCCLCGHPQHLTSNLSCASQRADRRHDVNWLDSSRLPLLVQNIGPLQDLLAVGVEHALRKRPQKD